MESYDETIETVATDSAISKAEAEFATDKQLYDARTALSDLRSKYIISSASSSPETAILLTNS